MHYEYIEDPRGELVDAIPLCSDYCHQEYCRKQGREYRGWNGCHEGSDYARFCANCGVFCGGQAECEHQTDNVAVNRFVSEQGEKCEHGYWIQLPAESLKFI